MAKRKTKRKYTKKNTSYWQSFTPSGYKRYSGIKMPKILVNKYLAGKLSADSLIKNIIKNNPGIHADKNSTVETLLGAILKRKDRTVAEN